MFVVLLTYKKSLEVVEKYLVAHRAYLEEGYQKDYFIVSGPQQPRVGGIIISQLSDRQKLEQVLKQDPFILNDVADYQIIEFQPVKYHRGFVGFLDH